MKTTFEKVLKDYFIGKKINNELITDLIIENNSIEFTTDDKDAEFIYCRNDEIEISEL